MPRFDGEIKGNKISGNVRSSFFDSLPNVLAGASVLGSFVVMGALIVSEKLDAPEFPETPVFEPFTPVDAEGNRILHNNSPLDCFTLTDEDGEHSFGIVCDFLEPEPIPE